MVKFLMQLFSACYQKLIKAEKEDRKTERRRESWVFASTVGRISISNPPELAKFEKSILNSTV